MRKTLFAVCILVLLFGGATVLFAQATPEAEEGMPEDGFKVAYQLGKSGNSYRELGIVEFENAAERYIEQGLISEYTIYRNVTNGDVQEQISQIRDIISLNYDVVVVNPNSDTALNGVYEEAIEAGLTVIVLAIPSHPDVWGVMGDNYGDYYDFAEWVVEASGGEGRAFHIYGMSGSPNNKLRMEGVYDAIEGTDIEIVAEQSGAWSVTQAKEVATGLLASHRNIDIVFTQDPMDEGVLGAFRDAGSAPEYTFATIAPPSFELLKTWMDEGVDIEFYAPKSHAGLPQAALYVGLQLAAGKELKDDMLSGDMDNSIIVPNPGPAVTRDNFDEFYEVVKDKEDDWLWAFTVEDSDMDEWFR